jgi:inner membrane protein involved in colicin E2 resistance
LENRKIGDHLHEVAMIMGLLLKWILTKMIVMVWIGLNWLVIVSDSCKDGNELSGSLRIREILYRLLAPHKRSLLQGVSLSFIVIIKVRL